MIEVRRSPPYGTLALCLRLARYPMRRWRGLLAVVLLVLPMNALGLLKPWPLKLLVDNVLHGQPLSGALAAGVELLVGKPTREDLLIGVVGATFVVFLLSWVLRTLSAHANITFGQRLTFDLASDLFEHIQRLSLRFHGRSGVGDSIKRVTKDCGSIATIVRDALLPSFAALFTLATMLGILLRLDATLTWLALGAAPLMVLAFRRYSRPMFTHSHEQHMAEGRLYNVVEQTLSSLPVVLAFGREDHARQRLQATTGAILDATLSATSVQLKFKAVMGLTSALGTAAILWVGAEHVLRGDLSFGGILVFIAYLGSLYGVLETLVYAPLTVRSAQASAERVLEILEEKIEVEERADARVLSDVAGNVRFENVSFAYTRDRAVLHGISFEARAGETVAILGPTGAGKSTLVSLLLRSIDPTDGRVTIDGQDLRDLSLGSLREHVAIVPQDSFLFPISIAENVAYARPGASREQIVAAARAANAHEFIERLPRGYDTVVGERGVTLSGGERQRVAIARALLKDAPILILDEPTSALDARSEGALLQGIEHLSRGRTTFVIAHRLSTIRRAHKLIVLEAGRIAEQGSPAELLASGGAYARLHGIQALASESP